MTILGGLAALAAARPAGAAVTLGSLSQPTVQTLIDLGNSGAIAGDARYFGFAYAGTAAAPAADQVRVQAVDTGSGLRFVGSWVADDGAALSSTISFDVAPADPAGGDAVGQVNLLSNGTAPVPAGRTFVTATATAQTTGGTLAAPLLTTYDDGRSFPVDTTAADVDTASAPLATPQSQLAVTDTLTAVAGPGGLATASVVQNGFTFVTTAVPEPAMGLTLVAVGLAGRRGRGGKAK